MTAPITYFGGKGNLKTKILPLLPASHIYCEPFGGGGSILFHREPSPVEYYNDLDENLVNLFRVLQNPKLYPELMHRLEFTLYSRREFDHALQILQSEETDPILRAWAVYVRQNQGFAGMPKNKTWGRAVRSSSRGMASTTSRWNNRLTLFQQWHERLKRVQIECRPALDLIAYLNEPETLIYVDPPYPSATRKSGEYFHEMSDSDHRALVDLLCTFKGSAVISTYHSPLYDPLVSAGYEEINFQTVAHCANKTRSSSGKSPTRTEVVYRRVRG